MRVYRSVIPFVGGGIGAIALFFVGVGGMLPSSHAGASGVIICGIVLAFSLVLASAVTTNRLIMTDEGIISWHTFRKKTIPWSSIKSLGVGRPRGMLPWPGLVINSTSGRIRVDSIVGSRSFVEKVAAELRSFQRAQSNTNSPVSQDTRED
jgi:hypothetical protein